MTNSTHERERRFQLLVEAVSDQAIYMLDPDGRVMSWNPAAERIKGYAGAEIEGRSFEDFFTLEDRREGLPGRILTRAREDGRVESEGWRVRKDGTRFWANATVHAIRAESGDLIGFAKVTRDRTEQRAQEQALLESERRFRLLVEGVIDYSIFMLDVNGMIANWNRGAERIKGYSQSEAVGRHFSMFYTPEDRSKGLPARALAQATKEGRYEAEGWRVRKDGGRFWASVIIDAVHDDDGRLIGFAKITRDISERRKAEEALIQSERQFRMLLAGVVDYALIMLDPNGVVANWNSGAQQIKGYKAEEIVGRHISVFYTEPDRLAGLPTRALTTAAEQGRYEAEAWRVRKDGSLFWANVVIDAIRDEAGELVGFAKITRDITERRNAQVELQKAHERLAQAQKMEAIGQLTGGVAHDFNNLLMVVTGNAQLLRRKLEGDERAVRSLDAIDTAARRGQDLTRHLLAFARRQRLNPMPVALADRQQALTELLSASVGSLVELFIDLSPDLWPVQVDPSELELAILNLAVNARDAMPAGGRLSVTARNVRAPMTRGAGVLDGEFVVISVKDTGQGIPPDILSRVFEPFFTTKEVDRGTGLGLSQVYGFVQQSGGHVDIDSELGQGVAINIYLPRSTGRATTVAEVEAGEAPSGLDILVVEDNPEVAEVTVDLLQQLGNRARLAPSAAAALQALHDELPDLVLSDIVMAGEIDGLGLARTIRERWPAIPVLLATGYSQAAEKIAGEFPILAKPYELAELSRALGAVVSHTRAA